MSQYANIKDAFLHCDVDKLILEYCKIPDGESSKVTIERASAEVHAAMERIKQTQPEKAEKQNLLIVCKTFEENETDTFCVEADDIAEWKKRRASKSEQPEEIGDEMLTFMDTDAIFDAAKAVDVPTKYAIEFCEWKDILSWKLAELSIAWYGLEFCLARVLWEMVFFGVEPEKMEKAVERIKNSLDEAKKELENDSAPRTYKSFEDIVKEILGDDYNENWYPEEERERDRRNLAIASYKCCKEYERILKGEVQV